MRNIFNFLILVLISNNILADDLSATITNASFGSTDGSIVLNIDGGVEPFTCSWTGPDGFVSTEQNISDLTPGEYCVVVNDFYCGIADLCVTVEEKDPEVSIQNIYTDNIQVYPNPFAKQLYISMITAESNEYIFQFSDMSGKEIYSKSYLLHAGENNLMISISEAFPSGNLLLKVTDADDKIITKQIIHIKLDN
ncbi:MAG: T9SS type A sorting domain-containing protein [Fimbriimonadaceae bacterium]|nr:T9SS type A sorting domain-containing protein [Chitinophagales bacterium]